jgi:hypothetical protein
MISFWTIEGGPGVSFPFIVYFLISHISLSVYCNIMMIPSFAMVDFLRVCDSIVVGRK